MAEKRISVCLSVWTSMPLEGGWVLTVARTLPMTFHGDCLLVKWELRGW